MPRKIPSDVLEKLSSVEWLANMHVSQLFSIGELSHMLCVTPAVVRKALRKQGIVSPSQQQLREASNMRKYGVVNPGAVPEFRDKALATMVERFGGHNWSTPNRDQRDATCMERYGNTNVGKTEYSKTKAKETNLLRYGRLHKNQKHISDEAFAKLSDATWLTTNHHDSKMSLLKISEILGVKWNSVVAMLRHSSIEQRVYTHHISCDNFLKLTDPQWMVHQNTILTKSCIEIAKDLQVHSWTVQRRFAEQGLAIKLHHASSGEREIGAYIGSLGVDIVPSDRSVLSPKELDIYIPSHKLAIEYCGVYWHGESRGKDRYYHKNKHDKCSDNNIQLLTIYDWEWNNRQEQVKTKIASLLHLSSLTKVYARKCSVVDVSVEEKAEFFNRFHIQGTGPGSITYGLKHGGELVACMTFVQRACGIYSLNRYATSCSVPGGFTKLLAHFTRNNEWKQIESFADLRWSNGKLYERTGFVEEYRIPPDYMYIVNGKPCHKFAYRHASLKTKLPNYDQTLSEWENMKAHGYDRIWDCGKIKFVMQCE